MVSTVFFFKLQLKGHNLFLLPHDNVTKRKIGLYGRRIIPVFVSPKKLSHSSILNLIP